MQVVAVYDPQRRPASWAEIIQPGQVAAFGTPSDGTCALFDSLADARAWCEAAVAAAPDTRFDLFDVDGRARPPLLTVVHPSRAARLDGSPRAQHRRRILGWLLIAAGVALVAYACAIPGDIRVIFPAVIGINLILTGGRLLWFNLAVRETERAREDRIAQLAGPPDR